MSSSKLQHPDSCGGYKEKATQTQLFRLREANSARAIQYKDVNTISGFGNSYSAACQNLGTVITVFLSACPVLIRIFQLLTTTGDRVLE